MAKSVSDKDGQFTGIPMQTRILAEAFDEEVIISVNIEKNEMDETRSTYGGRERRIEGFGGQT